MNKVQITTEFFKLVRKYNLDVEKVLFNIAEIEDEVGDWGIEEFVNWYVENLETVKQIKEKRKTRFDNRTTRYVRKFTVPAEVAKKYVKKVKGFKTIHTKDIQKAYTKFENLRTVDKGLGVMVTEYNYQLFVVTAKKLVTIPMGRNGLPGGWNLVH